jgi:predicted TPR repeat methyltransferase
MSVEPWSPWDFAASPYEQGRYDEVLAGLLSSAYRRAYEPGCSIGVLTERLAPRCMELWGVDVSTSAIAAARARCSRFPRVHLDVGSVADPPPPDLDLVVFSEIGYYFEPAELDTIIEQLSSALRADGELVACHWLGHSVDHRLHGSVVHDRLRATLEDRFALVHHYDAAEFVIDGWRRP